MKKIVIMYDFFSEHGGIERIMLFQAKALRNAGYNVVFAFAYVDDKLKEERLKGFEVVEYAKLPLKNETLQICSSILRQNIVDKLKDASLVICHSFPASYLALRLKKKFNVPYVLHMHHPPQFLYNVRTDWAKSSFKRKFAFLAGKLLGMPLKLFDSYCVKNTDSYVSECKTVQRIVKETYGIESEVVYPTIDSKFKLTKANLKELSKYGIKQDYILGSGRVIKQKRFDYLVNAFSKLNKSNLQLVIAGKYDSKTKQELEEIAKQHNANVLFLGPVETQELAKLYSLAKTAVLTCPKEWFGIVPIEAMSCGCPVVAWKDNSGPQETVIDNVNGFLAEPYNVDDLSEKIKKAIDKKWNKNLIVKSVQKFTEENQSKVLLSFLKKKFPKEFS